MLGAYLIPFGHSNPGTSAGDRTADSGVAVLSKSYAPHAPIMIDCNADFVSQGWPGDGSEANPYLIGGLEIDGAGYKAGILVGNATSFFAVEDCYVHGASEVGILVLNVTHGVLVDNVCDANSWYGVAVLNSGNLTLDNNTCSHTKDGIYMVSTDDSGVVNNTCADLDKRGIYLSSSDNNTVTSNNCSGNHGTGVADDGSGIVLESSSRNTLTKNLCNMGRCGILLSAFSHDCLLLDNFCSFGTRTGISILSSNNATVQGNLATFNRPGLADDHGISLAWSNNSRITGNNCSSNDGEGISVGDSSGVLISENTCLYNVGWGNMFMAKPGNGIYIYSSSGAYVSNNTCSFNLGHGIEVASGDKCTLSNNTCSSNDIYGGSTPRKTSGLHVQSSEGIQIGSCIVTSNTYAGIVVEQSGATRISNCIISSNDAYGVFVSESLNTTILNCQLSSNADSEINLFNTRAVVLKNDAITGRGIVIGGYSSEHWNTHDIDTSNTVNGKPVYYWANRTGGTVPVGASQVILASCTGVVVELQDLRDVYVGILSGFSSGNELRNNVFWGDLYGICLCYSDSNTIQYNSIEGSSGIGLYVEYSSFNTIWNNAFITNAVQADEYGAANNYWNITGRGNYWSDWTSPDIDMNGIVDNPYTLPSGSKDYFPLTTPPAGIPEFGSMLVLVVVGSLFVLFAMIRVTRSPRN
jgi:parallel beta-helix repeat protein